MYVSKWQISERLLYLGCDELFLFVTPAYEVSLDRRERIWGKCCVPMSFTCSLTTTLPWDWACRASYSRHEHSSPEMCEATSEIHTGWDIEQRKKKKWQAGFSWGLQLRHCDHVCVCACDLPQCCSNLPHYLQILLLFMHCAIIPEFNLTFADFDGRFRLSLHIEPHHIDRILLLHPIIKLDHL